jgi:hypothetical protein
MGFGAVSKASTRSMVGLMHRTPKGSKMNWLKRRIRRWLDSEQDIILEDRYPSTMAKNSISGRDVGSDPTLQFKIYSAIGGKVVEFSRYDRQKDRHHHDIYIIGKDEDFGSKIARIAMLESMKD